jgi:hypothetical protein
MQKFKVRKMNPFGQKYEQLTIPKESGVPSWFDCHVGEWKKGYVHFVPEQLWEASVYRVIVGDKELKGLETWVVAKDKQVWQSAFEGAGFEVRYTKPQA